MTSQIDYLSFRLTRAYIAAAATIVDPEMRAYRQKIDNVVITSLRTGFCILQTPDDPSYGTRRIKKVDLEVLRDNIDMKTKEALIDRIADAMAKAPYVMSIPIKLAKDQALVVQQYWAQGFRFPSFQTLGITDIWTSLDQSLLPAQNSNEEITLFCIHSSLEQDSFDVRSLLQETCDSKQLMEHFRALTRVITLDLHRITTDEILLLKLYVANLDDDLNFKHMSPPDRSGKVAFTFKTDCADLQLEIRKRSENPEFIALAEELSKELPRGFWLSTYVRQLRGATF